MSSTPDADALAAAAAAAANAAALAHYVPDPSYDPNAPVVATYPQNSNILYTDPTTGALVFPTDIQTASGSLKPLSYASFNTVVLPSDDIRQYILFSACLLYTSPSPRD